MSNFNFEQEKAINAVLFILKELGETDFHKIFKILYFADQKHLVDFGRPIIGDSYIKMQNGPVPSAIYDMLKEAKATNSNSIYFNVNRHFVNSDKEPNLDFLSESDIECIKLSIFENKDLSFNALKNKSHDEAYNQSTHSISEIKIAKAGGANDEMLKYIYSNSENQGCFL